MHIQVRPLVLLQASQITERISRSELKEGSALLILMGAQPTEGCLIIEVAFEIPSEGNFALSSIDERKQQYACMYDQSCTNFIPLVTHSGLRCCGCAIVSKAMRETQINQTTFFEELPTKLILKMEEDCGELAFKAEFWRNKVLDPFFCLTIYSDECDKLSFESLLEISRNRGNPRPAKRALCSLSHISAFPASGCARAYLSARNLRRLSPLLSLLTGVSAEDTMREKQRSETQIVSLIQLMAVSQHLANQVRGAFTRPSGETNN